MLYAGMSYLVRNGHVPPMADIYSPSVIAVGTLAYLIHMGISSAKTFERIRISSNTQDKLGL
jgi:hypothetical protein